MTKPGEKPPSQFDARADNAALALRANLKGKGREMPDRAPVQVDANGKPPAPLPPQGSYARQALELEQRRQQAAQGQANGHPPQRAEDLAQDPAPEDQPPQPDAQPTSPRAEQRIQELVGQLRQKDAELAEAISMGKKATETATQFQQRLTALETEHQTMIQQNLDHLDPATRAEVLADARFSKRMDEMEQRIMGRLQPTLSHLTQTAVQQEMSALSQKYPGFNYHVHAPLIEQFRASNPRCSIEQAFRAVAEPEELGTRSASRAQVVPPIVPPGNGDLGTARFTPQRRNEPRPEDELVEESRRIAELRRSTDPAKQKEGMQLLDAHLKRRLGGQ